MTDKELRKLGRAELVEIIYELQKRDNEAQKLIEELSRKIEEQSMTASEMKPVIDAAAKINDFLSTVQAAPNRYFSSVHELRFDAEAEIAATCAVCEQAVEMARAEAEEILRSANEEKEKIISDAEKEAANKWEDIYLRVKELF